MESNPGKDAMKVAEMTTEDLEYYIKSVDRAATGFERTDSNFERRSTVDKMLPHTIICSEKEKRHPLFINRETILLRCQYPKQPVANPIKVPITSFAETKKLILEFIWTLKGLWVAQTVEQ